MDFMSLSWTLVPGICVKRIPGGKTVPCDPPVFDVPKSTKRTHKPPPCPKKEEDRQLAHFIKNDWITSLSSFKPEKELRKKSTKMRILFFQDQMTDLIVNLCLKILAMLHFLLLLKNILL